MKIGIDFGTKYTKMIALSDKGDASIQSVRTKKISRPFISSLLKKIHTDEVIESLSITGGNVGFLPDEINDIPITKMTEWESLYDGANLLHSDKEYVLVNCGSGTSIHLITAEMQKHIGGTAMGGAMIDHWKHFLRTDSASRLNDVSTLHSTVEELIGSIQGLQGEWPGAYFNNLQRDSKPEDILAALEQMIGDEIFSLAFLIAKTTLNNTMLLTGGTLRHYNVYKRLEYWADNRSITLLHHDWNTFIPLLGLVGLPNSIEIQ